MAKNNIVFNMSLEQYNKKYHNHRYRLIKFNKKEVEEFDKKHNRNDKCLLATRKWALIGDAYYEIPRAPRFTWFRNLHVGIQIGTCVLAAGAVAGGAFGIYAAVKSNKSTFTGEVDELQWKAAMDKIMLKNETRNLKCVMAISISGINMNCNFYLDKNIEKYTNTIDGVARPDCFTKRIGQNEYQTTSDRGLSWTSTTSFYFDASNFSPSNVITEYYDYKNLFTLKDGVYECKMQQATKVNVVTIKFSSNNTIGEFNWFDSGEGATGLNINIALSDYGSVSIPDFPQ